MHRAIIALGLLSLATPARAQLLNDRGVVRKNQDLAGRIVDFTRNHGADRRLFSPILGMPRDLYVYLPPGYTPSTAYPLILYFHGAFGDEHSFLDDARLEQFERLILAGVAPPCIVACPDGGYTGRNFSLDPQSFYINGRGGRFEDHIVFEVLPFLMSHFSIRPEREAHAIHGYSSGAFGALSLAIRHRDFFGSVAVIGPPANLRYTRPASGTASQTSIRPPTAGRIATIPTGWSVFTYSAWFASGPGPSSDPSSVREQV